MNPIKNQGIEQRFRHNQAREVGIVPRHHWALRNARQMAQCPWQNPNRFAELHDMSMYVSMYMYMYMYMYIRHVHVHQPHPGCLLLPVHTYFKIKAADSKLFIKGADGSTRIDVRAATSDKWGADLAVFTGQCKLVQRFMTTLKT